MLAAITAVPIQSDSKPPAVMESASPQVRIFVSYSRKDDAYRAELIEFLKGLHDDGAEFWWDERIEAGAKWDEEIRKQIEQSKIALVLVSNWFLDSSYCRKVEIPTFLAKNLKIVPIILSPCEWESHPWLAESQFFPRSDATGNRNIAQHFRDPGDRAALHLAIKRDLRQKIQQTQTETMVAARASARESDANQTPAQQPKVSRLWFSSIAVAALVVGGFALSQRANESPTSSTVNPSNVETKPPETAVPLNPPQRDRDSGGAIGSTRTNGGGDTIDTTYATLKKQWSEGNLAAAATMCDPSAKPSGQTRSLCQEIRRVQAAYETAKSSWNEGDVKAAFTTCQTELQTVSVKEVRELCEKADNAKRRIYPGS